MSTPYSHWSRERTLEKVFGDVGTLNELVEAFLDTYHTSLKNLQDYSGTQRPLWDEIHNLRSMFGIFHADAGYDMAVRLDRACQQGLPVADEDRLLLIEELQAFSLELQHYLRNRPGGQ